MQGKLRSLRGAARAGCVVGIVWAMWVLPAHGTEHIQIGGSGTDLATFGLIANAFMEDQDDIKVSVLPSLGSGGGVRALAAGKVDIALTSRPLKKKEQNPNFQAVHYGRTPMVFAVKDDSPIVSANIEELAAIYSGKQRTWNDGSVVRPILRPPSDSDTLVLRNAFSVFDNALDVAYKRPGIPTATSDQDSADMMERIPGALGTSTLALLNAEKRSLKALTLDGVAPSAATIAQGRYPMVKDLYLVVSVKPTDQVKRFLAFFASQRGMDILNDTGHLVIPMDIFGM